VRSGKVAYPIWWGEAPEWPSEVARARGFLRNAVCCFKAPAEPVPAFRNRDKMLNVRRVTIEVLIGLHSGSRSGTGSAGAVARHAVSTQKIERRCSPISYVQEPRPTKLGYVPDLIRACSCSTSCCQISRCFGSYRWS